MTEQRSKTTGRALAKRPWVVWSAVCPTIVQPTSGREAFAWATGFADRAAAEARARALVSRYRPAFRGRAPEARICAAFVQHDVTRERGAGFIAAALAGSSWRPVFTSAGGPWEDVGPAAEPE